MLFLRLQVGQKYFKGKEPAPWPCPPGGLEAPGRGPRQQLWFLAGPRPGEPTLPSGQAAGGSGPPVDRSGGEEAG